ncbi:hypothetical protein GCM10025780_00470 [Frondihabitans cladoniiphilus]|uniref:Uncharacterized protein n=1 Tax=Frondihabitans cladoniiphilus TaxID=715785 RepID=A0ABP8VIM9_9MICO
MIFPADTTISTWTGPKRVSVVAPSKVPETDEPAAGVAVADAEGVAVDADDPEDVPVDPDADPVDPDPVDADPLDPDVEPVAGVLVDVVAET